MGNVEQILRQRNLLTFSEKIRRETKYKIPHFDKSPMKGNACLFQVNLNSIIMPPMSSVFKYTFVKT